MPFTLAHPAAIIPLRRALGRHSVVSAMVIGSMAPDLHHFLPVNLGRAETHSLAGTFLFCLPLGMLLYLVFHMLIKQPLLSLLPARIALRLDSHAPLAPPVPVLLSLLFGVTTHFVWDTFTHADALGVALVSFLQTYLFTFMEYPVFAYKIVQHGSAMVGLLWMAWWVVRWVRHPVTTHSTEMASRAGDLWMLSPWQRIAIVGSMVLLAGIAGILSAIGLLKPPFDIYAWRLVIREAIITAISTVAVAGFVYSVAWHFLQARRSSVSS